MHACSRGFCVGSLAVFALACGSKGSDSGAAGASSVAGAPAAGSPGAAGAAPVAGSPGSGGASGGAPSSGGAPATAGSGGDASITKSYSFDTTVEAWKVEYTSSGPITVGPMMGMTAPLISPIDPALTVSWLGTDGLPATPPGALQVNIPYSTASQYVGVGISLTATTKVDLTGKVLHANVKVLSGLGDPTDLVKNPGGAKLYVKSGVGYVYAAGTYTNVPAIGTWIPIEFDLSDPSYVATSDAGTFDPSDVREIGIQLDTGGMTTTAMPAVDLIDTVTY